MEKDERRKPADGSPTVGWKTPDEEQVRMLMGAVLHWKLRRAAEEAAAARRAELEQFPLRALRGPDGKRRIKTAE